jgi:para-aminobenzoate synthetase component I
MCKDTCIKRMNEYGSQRLPFIFIIDFDMEKPVVFPVSEVPSGILYDLNGFSNIRQSPTKEKLLVFEKAPISFSEYQKVFDKVMHELHYGNSYLLNLTFPTKVSSNYSTEEIFHISNAKYKMLWEDRFVVFSPEIFATINAGGKIASFPMKGTIDADIENAEEKLKNDTKEFAEHCTIVDLIRNDLSMVAKEVKVKRFGYTDYIKTNQKTLIQLSSEIEGKLHENFYENLGNIIFTLLPAGSVSGAPKRKTIEILSENETHSRGYYTGVMGYFDGSKLESAVMIRYIDLSSDQWLYKSGGGITINSQCAMEYNEMLDKVYVPII